MKYNDEAESPYSWTTKKLKSYTKMLYECIYGQNSCFSIHDLREYDACLNELNSRGVEVNLVINYMQNNTKAQRIIDEIIEPLLQRFLKPYETQRVREDLLVVLTDENE